jgi:hypothetical protein
MIGILPSLGLFRRVPCSPDHSMTNSKTHTASRIGHGFNGFSQSLQRAASCPHHAAVDVRMSHGAGGFRLATRNRFWAENLGLGAGRSTSVEARVDDIARKGIRAF